MPTTRNGRLATPHELAAAAGITTTTGPNYQLIDRYGVTYTGTASHLALNVVARADLTPELYRDAPFLQAAVRATARRLALWFTCPYVDEAHAAAFATLTPYRVCELIVHVCNHGHREALSQVGPTSLRFYTAYLLSDAVDDPEQDFPTVVDKPHRMLSPGSDGRLDLNIQATAPDGAHTVDVRMDIDATETFSWSFVADVPVPTNEVNALLWDANSKLSSWLEARIELIDNHLVESSVGLPKKGITTSARLAMPGTPLTHSALAEPTTPTPRTDVVLFFVGPDRDAAVTSRPFLDCTEATMVAKALGHQFFTTTASATELNPAGPTT